MKRYLSDRRYEHPFQGAVFCRVFVSLLIIAHASGLAAESQEIRAMAFSPDGKLFAACASKGTEKGELAVWDAKTWDVKYVIRDEKTGFPRLAFSPDSGSLALARFTTEALVLDAATGKTKGTLIGHTDYVRSIAYAPDGKQIVTGGYDGSIRFWDAQSFDAIHTIKDAGDKIYDVEVSPDGKTLAVADAKSYVFRVFDMATYKQLFVSKPMGSLVPDVAVSPDGTALAVSSWGGYCRLYDFAVFEQVASFDTNSADHASFAPDGSKISISASNKAIVYSLAIASEETQQKVQKLIADFESDDYQVRMAAEKSLKKIGPASRSQLIAARGSDDPEVRIRCRRLNDYFLTPDSAVQLRLDADAACSVFTPDGEKLATGDEEGGILVWNVEDWSKGRELRIPTQQE